MNAHLYTALFYKINYIICSKSYVENSRMLLERDRETQEIKFVFKAHSVSDSYSQDLCLLYPDKWGTWFRPKNKWE